MSETCRRGSITLNFEKININPFSENYVYFPEGALLCKNFPSTTFQEFSDKHATCLLCDLIIACLGLFRSVPRHRMSIVKCNYANYLVWQGFQNVLK